MRKYVKASAKDIQIGDAIYFDMPDKRIPDFLMVENVVNSNTSYVVYTTHGDYELLDSTPVMVLRGDNKYPEYIMKNLRQRLGLEENDITRDDLINEYSPKQVVDEYLKWEGIIGFTSTIIGVIEDSYGINLD